MHLKQTVRKGLGKLPAVKSNVSSATSNCGQKICPATRHDYHVPQLCCHLHARCAVVPAAVTFQMSQRVFYLRNYQPLIQLSGSLEKHGCDGDFYFLKNVNGGHLKKLNLPKYPPRPHNIYSVDSLGHDPVVPSVLAHIRSEASNGVTVKTHVH